MAEARPSEDQVNAAIRLMIVYEFEGTLHLTDSFKETIRKIKKEEDMCGIIYQDYNDRIILPDSFSCEGFLYQMADSLLEVHIARDVIECGVTHCDHNNATEFLTRLLLNRYWLQKIRTWTESPDNWYEFITATKNFTY